MSDFGKCADCDRDAVVVLDDRPVCLDDYEKRLKKAVEAVKKGWANWP